MIVQSHDIVLRAFTLDDVDKFFHIAHNKQVKQFVPYAYCAHKRKAKKLIKNYVTYDFKNDFYFAICLPSGEMVGAILSYRIPNSKVLDVSYFIGHEYRQKGYMHLALMLFIETVANSTDFDFLRFAVSPYNEESMAIMWSLGVVDNGDEMIYYYPLSWAREKNK